MEDNGLSLLKNTSQKLEKVTEEVLKNQGYTEETEKLMILLELLREQVPHENNRP